ncbi:MAG: hypothetical protein AB1810_12605 [Pseudomonadota bacterium]
MGAGVEAGLFGDAEVVAGDLGAAVVEAGGAHACAERRDAQTHPHAGGALVGLVGVAVLQAVEDQVAAGVGIGPVRAVFLAVLSFAVYLLGGKGGQIAVKARGSVGTINKKRDGKQKVSLHHEIAAGRWTFIPGFRKWRFAQATCCNRFMTI